MLLKITNKCLMNCSHCSEESHPDGEHMDSNTFYKATELIKKLKPKVVLVTGGEPLENPNFFAYVKYLKTIMNPKGIMVTSNGMFLKDKGLYHKCNNLGVQFQIMNDKRYYPQRIKYTKEQKNNPNFTIIIDDVLGIYPQGRAVTNGIAPTDFKATKCFNIRNATKAYDSLESAIALLELKGKVCTPCISEKGNVHLGEGRLCGTIGTVDYSVKELEDNIKTFTCSNCGTAKTGLYTCNQI